MIYHFRIGAAALGLFTLVELAQKPSAINGQPAIQPLTLRIIDSSTAGESCEDEGIEVWRVEVRSPRRTDTLANVVQPWPVALDTAVDGVAAAPDGCTRRLFQYSAHTGRVSFYKLPSEMWHYFWDVTVSPDGRHILYLAMDSVGRESAVVRRWPAGPVVVRGPVRDGCDCDVDRHHAHWVTPDSFELATQIGRDNPFERVSGSVRARRVHVDTLNTVEEYWHPPRR